jgi:hypothetical protein
MSDRTAFGTAVAQLSQALDRRSSLSRPFVSALPVTGAAVSTLGPPFGSETVSASDATAARLDEVQFDLGEGPCWDALSSRRPVLAPDFGAALPRWPLFTDALGDTDVRSLFSFPMALGSLNIGAVDLYSRQPAVLTEAQVGDATALSSICARQVLRRTLTDKPSTGGGEDDTGFSRREVHQATGMVLAQLGVSAADALLIINGYAFARGQSVRAVAADIVARRIDFADEWSDPSESL